MTNPRSDGEIHGKAKPKRPPAVGTSPVQFHCRLCTEVPLYGTKTMILLQVDTYVIHQSVLRKQTTLHPNPISIQGNPDVRKITAKIDCLLLAPLATLGNGKFGTVKTIYHMDRPRPTPSAELNEDTCNKVNWEDHARWEIDNLIPADSNSCSELKYNNPHEEPITYSYCIDHHCPLGYNPMKQLVCPRLIGWISTYEPSSLNKNEKPIAHISPYSFFIDVSRGSRPMVAFAACPRTDEFADSDDENSTQPSTSDNRKDAQRDAELTGCFCVNFVSKDLAWAMNVSAAPIGKGLSEFNLMKSGTDKVKSGVTIPTFIKAPLIDAPMVNESPLFMECRYVKTIKVPDVFENDSMYSLIIGEVVNVHAKKEFALQSNNGQLELDVQKAKPVARLGYGQEYAVIEEYLL